MTTAMVLLTKNAAKALTKRIQATGADLAALLLEAHDGEAWRAMGYASWAAYVDGEFEFTRQHSYLLIGQGRVNAALVEAGSSERATVREAREVSYAYDTRDAVHNEPETLPERVIETLAEVRRGGPAPKPSGGKRRGPQAPTDQVRHWCDTLETWADATEGEPLPSDFDRVLRRLRDTIDGLLAEVQG